MFESLPPITKDEIAEGLRGLGLKKGDLVLLHSSLASLGRVEGGAEAVVDAFLDVLGDEGTLMVPTFGSLGIITDVVKNHPKAVNSLHPKASVAAIGADAKELCRDHWKPDIAHAEDTPYIRLAEKGGYVCLLGVDQDRNTTMHTVESLLRLPYLKAKEATFETPDGQTITKTWQYFPGPHRDFIGLDRLLRESGKMKMAKVGRSMVRLIKSQDMIDICLEAGREDPAYVLCDNPNCADCVEQRADLRRARYEKEDFTLVASASLAGDYPEEIADSCRKAGVDAVELDYVYERPVQMLDADRVIRAVNLIREEGRQVTALRVSATTAKTLDVMETAQKVGVGRVVAPLGPDAEELLKKGVELGVEVSLYNVAIGSREASDLLLALKEKGLKPRFTFNAANFAIAGEKPFLQSYKGKLRRFIDQLDVEDQTFDNYYAGLARGNAEIKEMVSILRCACFGGSMVLGSTNTGGGSLTDAAEAMDNLLDNM